MRKKALSMLDSACALNFFFWIRLFYGDSTCTYHFIPVYKQRFSNLFDRNRSIKIYTRNPRSRVAQKIWHHNSYEEASTGTYTREQQWFMGNLWHYRQDNFIFVKQSKHSRNMNQTQIGLNMDRMGGIRCKIEQSEHSRNMNGMKENQEQKNKIKIGYAKFFFGKEHGQNGRHES